MKLTGYSAQKSVKTGVTYVNVFLEDVITKDGGGVRSIEVQADEAVLGKLKSVKEWPVEVEADMAMSSTPSKFGGNVATFRLRDFEL